MEPTQRLVRCPCCKAPLYTLTTVKPGGQAGWELAKDSPPIEKDDNGPYMKCRHCSRRIGVVKDGRSPAGFRVPPGQKCDQILR